MTPAQSAKLDQLTAQIAHFVNGARLAKLARDRGNEKVAELIARVMSFELNRLSEEDLRGLVMTATSAHAELLNDVFGPPEPDKTMDEVKEFASTMEDGGMGAIVLAIEDDGSLVVPENLPEPIARAIREATKALFKDED
jgi:hypothetical protein